MNPPRRFLALLTVWLLAGTMLAGCIATGDDPVSPDGRQQPSNPHPTDPQSNPTPPAADPAPEPRPTEETGSLRGQLFNDDFTPIENAVVSLRNATGEIRNTTTDPQGNYTMNEIVPGTYRVSFSADCCAPVVKSIRIFANDVTTASAMLEIWLSSREHYTQEDQWTGYISCGTAYDAGICNQDPNQDRLHDFQVNRGLRTLVVAMDWTDGINMNDCLVLGVGPINHAHPDYAHVDIYNTGCQTPPIEFRLDAGNEYGSLGRIYDFQNITDWMPLQFRVDASEPITSANYNVAVQQSFTIYWREYYWEHAPDDASALPNL